MGLTVPQVFLEQRANAVLAAGPGTASLEDSPSLLADQRQTR